LREGIDFDAVGGVDMGSLFTAGGQAEAQSHKHDQQAGRLQKVLEAGKIYILQQWVVFPA